MLIYALSRDTNKLEHIDSVANGLKCNCFCSGCNDSLVAKNNCSDRQNHFSHYSKDENRNCLMTQLHLVAQHHFLNKEYITLPYVSFSYKGVFLNQKAINVKVLSAKLEFKIDRYFADVAIETEVGTIIIEVFVTHKNEDEKTAYYQNNKVTSIEYDLSDYISKSIDDAIFDLKNDAVPKAWLYEWCKDTLIQQHEQGLIQEKIRLQRKRERSARDSANKLINGNYITLPSLVKSFEQTIARKKLNKEVCIFTRETRQMTKVIEVSKTNEYILLKGILNSHSIWVVFLMQTSIPTSIHELEGSVVLRTPSVSSKSRASWMWFKYPILEKNIQHEAQFFLETCKFEARKVKTTAIAIKTVIALSDLYSSHSTMFYRRDYGRWSKWMQKRELFEWTLSKPNPHLPKVLLQRNYSCLWMFQTWHILSLSYLAEILDKEPINTKILYCDLFDKLAQRTSLSSQFLSLEQGVSSLAVKYNDQELIIRDNIIESALQPFAEAMAIHCLNNGCIRKESLLSLLSLR